MKKILLIAMTILLSITVNAQNGKKFNYKLSKSGSYMVTPVFDQTKGEGNKGLAFWSDESYAKDLFYNIIKEVFSKEELEKMHLRSAFMITFNTRGEILNCRFSIDSIDTNVISDDDLYNLYCKFKKMKIDMTKVKIDSGSDISNVKEFDYTEIIGSLIPLEYRIKINNSKK